MSGPFKRTVCCCSECVRCCETQPGSLVNDDIAPLEQATGEPLATNFVASPGAIVGKVRPNGRLEIFSVGSIAPRTVNDTGRCVFLTEDRKCRVHAVAPFGCSMFDVHMGHHAAQERLTWSVMDMMRPEYVEVRKTLPPATTWKGRPIREEER